MKVKIHKVKEIYIIGDHIKLDALLKFASIAATGGEAKFYILNGEVFVGGKPCVLRGKKIRPGDVVRYGNRVLIVRQQI